MLSTMSRSVVSAFVFGALLTQTSVIAVNTTYFSPASNVPEGFKSWLNGVVYPLTESTVSADGQRFVKNFAGNGAQGTFIIGPSVFQGADQILSAWTNVPKAVKSLEHVGNFIKISKFEFLIPRQFPTDVYWDGGSSYSVFVSRLAVSGPSISNDSRSGPALSPDLARTAPMLGSTNALQQVPLVGFLDAYPEPAFILCSNTGPRPSLEFIYGNSSLRELLVGHDESGILDDQTFFSAIASDEDIVWLSNPTHSDSQSTSRSIGYSHAINLRPAWLPRDHTSIDLELTPTLIELPITIPEVGSSSNSYVFTASPRKAPMNFLRSETQGESRRRKDPNLRLPDFPLMPGAIGPHIRSRMSKSDSSSMPSQSALAINPAELPSRLVDTYPWGTTPLGPRESWPVLLELMVKYLMETPVSVSRMYSTDQLISILFIGCIILGMARWGELWGVLAVVSESVRRGKSTCKADDGTVAGIFNITWETTQKVIAERRLSCMSEVSSQVSDAKTQQQFGERALEALSRNPLDLPFIALYWCEVEELPTNGASTAQASSARVLDYIRNPTAGSLSVKLTLAGSIGIPDDHPIAPPIIKYTLNSLTFRPQLHTYDSGVDVGSSGVSETTSRGNAPGSPMGSAASNQRPADSSNSTDSGLDITKAFASGSIELVDPLPVHLAEGLDARGFKDLPRMAAIMPISTNSTQGGRSVHGRTLPYGVLLLGINTRRAYDADYASWLESLGSALSNQLTAVLQREADMKMMEERERMDKAKTMFFTNVSHGKYVCVVVRSSGSLPRGTELRTPLTLIQAPLEQLLLSSNITSDAKYKLQLAVRNSRRLKKLIDSIMDMSKLEAGRLVGNFRPVQLARVTADLAALFRSMAEKKSIDYIIDCDVGSEPSVYVDIGVGIPKQHIDQVFDRFFRVNTNVGLMATLTDGGIDRRVKRNWFRFMVVHWVFNLVPKRIVLVTRAAPSRSHFPMDQATFLRLLYGMRCTPVHIAVRAKKWTSM
ncbi:HisKA domain-containing protein [Rhizoctonia solani AG-1 IA]|uniref:HisKA domain-containing protein n=1 Tax=Thanatephorus cucumeris (strain AG1-IA) TaxID=983506 RepID=L8WKI0_THACA|nr:HisKA domain-containing protein [Rhizoctonia solani AG-1 IA]